MSLERVLIANRGEAAVRVVNMTTYLPVCIETLNIGSCNREVASKFRAWLQFFQITLRRAFSPITYFDNIQGDMLGRQIFGIRL